MPDTPLTAAAEDRGPLPEVIDAHTHVMRSEDHGREAYAYFLSRNPRSGHPAEPPAYGTVDELRALMAQSGVARANMLMFTWSGQYWRDGQYALPDGGGRRAAAAEDLRLRIVERVADNNAWAVRTVREHPELSYFCGVDAVLMDEKAMLGEVENRIATGALGVKIVPRDMRIRGDDPRLRPLFDWCQAQGVPVLTEASGHPGTPSRPAYFEEALSAFPRLKLIFAHCGHNPVFGEGADAEVADLARRFDNVATDLSLRLLEVADGSLAPERLTAYIRQVGVDRVLYGSNYVLAEILHPESGGTRPQTSRTQASLAAFQALELDEREQQAVASANFDRITHRES